MITKIKFFIIQVYYFIFYSRARRLIRKGIRFDHFRELNKTWLISSGIKTVFDVGANEGQFAKLAREVFPAAKIYSFEPLPECYEKLSKALPGDRNFFSFNTALGSNESVSLFFPSVHLPSSSFLKMEDLHKEAFPYTQGERETQAIEVKVNSLDNLFERFNPEKNILLKIDVQGFENEVINGALKILEHIKVVIIEVSFSKLYQDQPLFNDVYTKMYNNRFRYYGNLAQMYHPVTNEVVQADAVFVREN